MSDLTQPQQKGLQEIALLAFGGQPMLGSAFSKFGELHYDLSRNNKSDVRTTTVKRLLEEQMVKWVQLKSDPRRAGLFPTALAFAQLPFFAVVMPKLAEMIQQGKSSLFAEQEGERVRKAQADLNDAVRKWRSLLPIIYGGLGETGFTVELQDTPSDIGGRYRELEEAQHTLEDERASFLAKMNEAPRFDPKEGAEVVYTVFGIAPDDLPEMPEWLAQADLEATVL